MKWTEPKPPTPNQSYYDHIKAETPLGLVRIEWKSWKESPSYDVEINNEWIVCVYSLEEAKEETLKYIKNKYNDLKKFLEETEL